MGRNGSPRSTLSHVQGSTGKRIWKWGWGIIWDNTWHCFSYLSAKKFPKMKIIHTNHGMVEWQKVPVKQLRFPRYIGVSRLHAKYMSSVPKIPVRYVHHGIALPPIEETKSNNSDKRKMPKYRWLGRVFWTRRQ